MSSVTQIQMADRAIGGVTVSSISARELHAFLGSRADFTTWVKNQIKRVRLVEGRDYLLHSFVEQLPSGAKSKIDYFVSVDSAKHIAMMSGTDRGFEVRDYFIECERQRHAAPAVPTALENPEALRNLLLGYTDRVVALEAENTALLPKARFHDAMADAEGTQSIEAVAKVLGTGQNRLFAFLRKQRILTQENLPHQEHIDSGRFRVVAGHYRDGHGVRHAYARTLVTGKGLAFIQRIFAASVAALPVNPVTQAEASS